MDHQPPPPQDPFDEARRAIEAIVLVATDPIPTQLLAQLVELPVESVGRLCDELAAAYDRDRRGFQLVQVGGGWRFQTHPELAPYVERFALDGQSTRMSTAALETLAIVAYKQPISRAQVSAIRGVNVDGVLRTLVQRGYVEEVGRDTGAGQAVLFGTTGFFLERVGLNTLDQLPALGDFVPAADVVEALEQTLRVEARPADDEAFIDGDDESAADQASTGGDPDDDVVDLRDDHRPEVLDLGPAPGDPAGTGAGHVGAPDDSGGHNGAPDDDVLDLRQVAPGPGDDRSDGGPPGAGG